jgi:hypothetical protein
LTAAHIGSRIYSLLQVDRGLSDSGFIIQACIGIARIACRPLGRDNSTNRRHLLTTPEIQPRSVLRSISSLVSSVTKTGRYSSYLCCAKLVTIRHVSAGWGACARCFACRVCNGDRGGRVCIEPHEECQIHSPEPINCQGPMQDFCLAGLLIFFPREVRVLPQSQP